MCYIQYCYFSDFAGSAADLCKAAMIQTVHNFTKVGIDGRLLIQIHDELLFEVKDEELTQAAGCDEQHFTLQSINDLVYRHGSECYGVS